MTLKTSLFNFGVYKNTLSRFKWGAVLYAIILFLAVPFAILVEGAQMLLERYIGGSYEGYLLFRGDYTTIPFILAVVVPTIVAVLAFNNMHSSRQGIFEHSIPVTRKKNYISSLLGSFTLMAAPVALNALILLVMSFTSYGQLIYPHTVLAWAAYQLAVIFIMFSVAVFAGFLTGNAAAHIGINILLHVIPVLAALVIYLVSDIFLYGFTSSENFIVNQLINYNPVVWLGTNFHRVSMFSRLAIWIYLAGALVLYVAAYLLYKNRKIEACGDVAAFSWFRPVLKYFVTAATAITVFGVFCDFDMGAVALFILVGVLTAIAYFATEMIMNKSFRVFKAYKGYIGFAVFVALFISFFAYTGVFGYETRVPDFEDIESASIYRGNAHDAVYVTGDDIELVRKIHQNFVTDIAAREKNPNNSVYASVTYKLKNGKEMSRGYAISEEEYYAVFDKMYEITDYKVKETGISKLNIENIDALSLRAQSENYHYQITVTHYAPEILAAIKKDIEELSFTEIEKFSTFAIRAHVSCTVEENEKLKYFNETEYDEDRKYMHVSFDVSINSSYKNTFEVLKKLGYYDEIVNDAAANVFISKIPAELEYAALSYKDDVGDISEFRFAVSDCARLGYADGKRLIEELYNQDYVEKKYRMTAAEYEKFKIEGMVPESKTVHFVFITKDVDSIWASSYTTYYTEENMPEYLKKYIR